MSIDMKLYEIAEDIRQICEGDEWEDTAMDALTHAFEVKAGNIVAIAEKMDAFAAYCKAEEERISAKRKAVEGRIAAMKRYLQNCMEQAGIMELPLGTKTLALQRNPPKVVIDDESAIPGEYYVVIPASRQLDKKLVSAAIKGGTVVPGAHTEQGLSLRIK